MRWRATYSDGSTLEEDDRLPMYSAIDRSRLRSFEVQDQAWGAKSFPLFSGQRLVFRKRRMLRSGVFNEVWMVALENQDRSFADLFFIWPEGKIQHRRGYTMDSEILAVEPWRRMPELLPQEEICS